MSNEKTKIICTCIVVVVFMIVGAFMFGASIGEYTITMDMNVDDDINVMTERMENMTIKQLDMDASCFKGCQFATQPVFNITPIDDQEVRIKLYDDCVYMCGNRGFEER